MKNKIFLTSMLAVMVACPVFAETVYHVDEGNTSADCVLDDDLTDAVPPRETGTYTLTAQWQATTCTISLDANGGTAGTQTELWTRYGDQYETDPYGAFVSSTLTTQNLMTTAGANALTGAALPTGPSANTTFVLGTAPTNPATGSAYTVSGVSNITHNLAFLGYTNQADTAEYIDSTGKITSDGVSAANMSTCPNPAPTWYAKWETCYNRPLSDVSLTGYDFGWYTQQTGGSLAANNDCISADETLYARWTAKQYTVTYNCGDGGSFRNDISPAFDVPSLHQDQVTYDQGYTFRGVANTCTKDGYQSSGWTCVQAGTNTAANTDTSSYWKNDYSVVCTANWEGLLYLDWETGTDQVVNTPASCVYGELDGIDPITQPTRTGYTFKGWTVTNYSAN